ncbi:MAG: signal transduction histidine kinase [Sphingomonas bacterium]|nr:signal transduction histidine kinase [Sphingomonas bacterium]
MTSIGATIARLSTGIKMLLILSTALLPLGLIALSASLQSARTNRSDREAEARLLAAASADELTGAVGYGTDALRTALGTLAAGRVDAATCQRAFRLMAPGQRWPTQFALFEMSGRRICATAGFSSPPVTAPTAESGVDARLIESARTLRFDIADRRSGLVAAGELPADTLRQILRPHLPPGSVGVLLRQGDADVAISHATRLTPLSQLVTASAPVANGQLVLELTVNATPIRAIEVLMVLLPVLMWAAAAGIGWLVVDRLLLRPLAQMQKAIAGYRIGDAELAIPRMTTPSHEIRELGGAFASLTQRLARHDAELEESLERQTLLTREVHHRVKNNLQVVASLINLHSRGATTDEARSAYATIQRRVDALSVVHRNHYAHLEENRGVSLRALIGELASNLRATAPPEAAGLAITLDLAPHYASQDVAVPVAFLITEIVELAMQCGPAGTVAIRLEGAGAPLKARLSVTASSLAGDHCRSHPAYERFMRVTEGLSRQLRAQPKRDQDVGSFAIDIPIAEAVPEDDG